MSHAHNTDAKQNRSDTEPNARPKPGTGESVQAEVYYMDYRGNEPASPDREDMYTYTPTASDLLNNYTHVGTDYARSVSELFHRWSDADHRNPSYPGTGDEDTWRAMEVGDIVVLDDTAYIIRPAGEDELNITIE